MKLVIIEVQVQWDRALLGVKTLLVIRAQVTHLKFSVAYHEVIIFLICSESFTKTMTGVSRM